jgi:predicted ATPase
MILGLTVKKFKAFNEQQNIVLKPITLLYGSNSAGKSSVLQSLLLLKQSYSESELENSVLIPKGKYLNLGNFKEMVYSHNLDEKIVICCKFNEKTMSPFLRKYKDEIKLLGYETIFYLDESNEIRLESLSLYCNDERKPLLRLSKTTKRIENLRRRVTRTRNVKKINGDISFFQVDFIDDDHELIKSFYSKLKLQLPKKINEIKKQIAIFEQQFTIIKEHVSHEDLRQIRSEYLNKLDEMRNIYKTMVSYDYKMFIDDLRSKMGEYFFLLDGFLVSGMSEVEPNRKTNLKKYLDDFPNLEDLIFGASANYREVLDSIVYLGPLREYPERHYIFSGISPAGVGKSGKYTSDLLFLNEQLTTKVNQWLEKFGIEYSVAVSRINDENISDVYTLRLVDQKTNVSVSPLDVGFGISQILPIIVQSLICTNSIICIEQPEIHIHPKLQTIFGSFIVDCLKNNNQFIIETHSEHIMLRIQKLIRMGKLNSSDVSIIYVDRQNDGSKCIQLRLDANGNFIDEWPNGFFEEGYEEVFS